MGSAGRDSVGILDLAQPLAIALGGKPYAGRRAVQIVRSVVIDALLSMQTAIGVPGPRREEIVARLQDTIGRQLGCELYDAEAASLVEQCRKLVESSRVSVRDGMVRVVVEVEGGCVNHVTSDFSRVSVRIVDYDNPADDNAEEEGPLPHVIL